MLQQVLEELLIGSAEVVDPLQVEAMEAIKCQVANTIDGNILKSVLVHHQIE